MSLEQARAVLFVLVARPGQLVRMQNLSGIVKRRPEQNGVPVNLQVGPSGLKGIQNLGSGIVNEGKMRNESRRRIERRQQMLGVRR